MQETQLITILLTITLMIPSLSPTKTYENNNLSLITAINYGIEIKHTTDYIQTLQEQQKKQTMQNVQCIEDKLKTKVVQTKETDETTLYTTTTLNVRSQPNKHSTILDTLNTGDKIIQTGICNNGWIRIQYNDTYAYVFEIYTSEQPPDINYGNAGRLYINDHSVALYYSQAQSVVDRKDSAATWTYDQTTFIADHWNQGFDTIKTCDIGDTCYILYSDGTRKTYICTAIDRNGHNTGYDIVDHNRDSVASYQGLVMYTCNDNWKNITLVYWKCT